jgi:hypothetical protein
LSPGPQGPCGANGKGEPECQTRHSGTAVPFRRTYVAPRGEVVIHEARVSRQGSP